MKGYISFPQEERVSIFVPSLLFVITLFTTLLAGALQQGVNPIKEPLQIIRGVPFALSLLTILLTHEMGHYLTSRYHGVRSTLPYFIPAPTLLGTFGAFIKMKSPILSKKALIDIGASGPVAGFIVSLFFTTLGLKLSQVVPSGTEKGIGLGSSLIFHILASFTLGETPDGIDVILHPIAFAGWIGLFVTSLNLLPIGQLDGGHIAYAIFGRRHRAVSIITLSLLVFFGVFGWPGWLVWGIIVSILGIGHPPVIDQYSPLDLKRKVLGWLTLLIFVLTFTPVPFVIG